MEKIILMNYLEIIKEIRTSERRFYQKVTDILQNVVLIIIKILKLQNDFYATIQK